PRPSDKDYGFTERSRDSRGGACMEQLPIKLDKDWLHRLPVVPPLERRSAARPHRRCVLGRKHQFLQSPFQGLSVSVADHDSASDFEDDVRRERPFGDEDWFAE